MVRTPTFFVTAFADPPPDTSAQSLFTFNAFQLVVHTAFLQLPFCSFFSYAANLLVGEFVAMPAYITINPLYDTTIIGRVIEFAVPPSLQEIWSVRDRFTLAMPEICQVS